MNEENPYAASSSPIGSGTTNDFDEIEILASGQRLVIYAILINIVGGILQATVGNWALLVSFVALAMSLVGILKLSSGLKHPAGVKVLMVILMIVPMVNLITLVILNGKATKILKENGYTVGLLGAKR